MANKSSKGFLLTNKFYKIANGANILDSKNRGLEGKLDIQPELVSIKKQENTKTKKITMQKIYANKLHAKLGHPREYSMRTTTNRLD